MARLPRFALALLASYLAAGLGLAQKSGPGTPPPQSPVPLAHFGAHPPRGEAPLTVHFEDRSFGNLTSWRWDFGDGTTSGQRNPSHLYTQGGVYEVRLTVSGPDGSSTVVKPKGVTVTTCTPGNARANRATPLERGEDFVPVTGDDGLGFWCVYSGKAVGPNNPGLANNVGMFVFPLASGEVLLFGSGYGDENSLVSPTESAGHDVRRIDGILRFCLGLVPQNTPIRFVAPHGHIDHINADCIHELRKRGYPIAEIVFHTLDAGESRNMPGWTAQDLAAFRTIRNTTANCQEDLLSYSSPLGRIWFHVRPGHTNGSIDLVLDTLGDTNNRFLVLGSGASFGDCPIPGVRESIEPHGNVLLAAPAPVLTALSPTHLSALGGTTVVLSGAQFAATRAGLPQVLFDGVPASAVQIIDDDTLTCLAPPGIPLERGTLELVNRNGTARLEDAFRYRAWPTLMGVTPAHGVETGGTRVTLSGTGFLVDAAGTNTITFDGVPATGLASVSDTSLTCLVPAGVVGPATIVLSNQNGAGQLADAFHYDPRIDVLGLSPSAGSGRGGLRVEVQGSGFAVGLALPEVSFGGVPGTDVVRLSDTRLNVTTPPGTPGAQVDVRVSAENGADTLPSAFRYFSAPRISAVTPPSGAAPGGNEVTLSGSSFQRNSAGRNTVLFGTQPALALTTINDTTLRCTVPPGVAGTSVDLVISNANGSGRLEAGYRYHRLPTLAAAEPAQGPRAGGTLVTLHGSGFQEVGAGAPLVEFAGQPALDVAVLDDLTLTCRTPAQASDGPVDVRLTNANGSASAGALFRYLSRPTLSALTPAEGRARGGTRVTLSGTGFLALGAGTTEIQFGGRPAGQITILDDGTLSLTAPLGTPGSTVDVLLRNANGSARLVQAFRYRELPTLTSIAPQSGALAGGTPVALRGSGFLAGVPSVRFAGQTAGAVQVVSDTLLTCVTPPGARGAVTLQLSNDDGSAFLPDGFVYGSTRPELGAAEPDHGRAAAPGRVLLRGRGFTAASADVNRVTFGGVAASEVVAVNDELLSCLAPPGAPGARVDVRLTNHNGSAMLPQGFRYHLRPTLVSLDPALGSPRGGESVSVHGSGFLVDEPGPTTLTFGGAPASEISVLDDATLTCRVPAGVSGLRVDVALANANGTALLAGAFLYHSAPELQGLAPTGVSPLGGATLTLTGIGFTAASLPTVLVGGVPAGAVVRLDDTQVTCTAPRGVGDTLVDVELTTENGSALLPAALRYFAGPDLVTRAPVSGPAAGGTTVVLNGSGFRTDVSGTNAVTFGASAARSVTTVDDTRVRAVTPGGTPGSEVDIRLANSNGADELVRSFRYHALPTLASVTPPSAAAAGGLLVTLRGAGFQRDSAGTNSVLFEATPASAVKVLDDQTLTCLAPAGLAGTSARVQVSNRNGVTVEAIDFRFHAEPTLLSVTPPSGFSGGGTLVELAGSGFLFDAPGAQTLLFGTQPASEVTVLSDVLLRCRVPAGAPGPVPVTLANANGIASLANGFQYDWAPTLTGFTPGAGSSLGGAQVTLTGGGFASAGAGALTVRFGSNTASEVTVVDGFHLTCRVPAGAAGSSVTVSVSNTRGSSALPGFLYHPLPSVTALSPAEGPPQGGTVVTLSGVGFLAHEAGVPLVRFGTSPASAVNVLSDTSLSCQAPAGPSLSSATIRLDNANGRATLVDGWSWIARHPGDLDGDGRGDLVFGSSDGVYLFFSDASLPSDESSAAADLVLKADLSGTDFGSALALGDLNGDQQPDLVVGAPLDDTGGTDSGSVYVFFGPLAAAPGPRLASSASAVFRGAAALDRFGVSLAVRDVNGDGNDDLLVGAPFNDQAATDAGAAYVFGGGAAFASQTTAQAQVRLLGGASAHNFGAALAAGDVNGDGQADVVVGAPLNGAAGGSSGAVHVFFGGAGLASASANQAQVTIDGAASNDRLGSAVAVGDIDGDGLEDLVLAAPEAKQAGNQSGSVFVLRGATTLTSGSAASAQATFTGEAVGDRLGQALALGDANGDGRLDLLLGSPLHDIPTTSAGRAYLVLGSANLLGGSIAQRASTIVMGDNSLGDQLGLAVALSDLDDDGKAELLVGCPFGNGSALDTGRVHVFLGALLAATRFASADDATYSGHLTSLTLGRRLTGTR